jgi:hypothetical protein
MAIEFALKEKRPSVTLVHKGNIQKFTEGAFREWGYEVAIEEFRADVVTERESWILGNKDSNPGLTRGGECGIDRAGNGVCAGGFPAGRGTPKCGACWILSLQPTATASGRRNC